MLKLNSTYKTKGGFLVEILHIDHNYKYPYFGFIEELKRPVSYTSSGRYKIENETKYDIII